MQNTSHAVMAQRAEPKDSPDDFPTPPWATRGLLEHVLDKKKLAPLTCLEPACGAGHMAKVLYYITASGPCRAPPSMVDGLPPNARSRPRLPPSVVDRPSARRGR
jgi:hypothetical protein